MSRFRQCCNEIAEGTLLLRIMLFMIGLALIITVSVIALNGALNMRWNSDFSAFCVLLVAFGAAMLGVALWGSERMLSHTSHAIPSEFAMIMVLISGAIPIALLIKYFSRDKSTGQEGGQ